MSETTVLDVPLDAVATSATPATKKAGAKRGAKPKLIFPGSVTVVEGKEVLTKYTPREVDGKKLFIPEGYDATKNVPLVRGNFNSKFDWHNFRGDIFDLRATAARAQAVATTTPNDTPDKLISKLNKIQEASKKIREMLAAQGLTNEQINSAMSIA